ncbi:hypothetical protein, partial [Marinobacterium sp. xm-m-312]
MRKKKQHKAASSNTDKSSNLKTKKVRTIMKAPALNIDAAFNNLNDVMEAMTTSGQKDLNIYEKSSDMLKITKFGMLVEMRNSDGNAFSVLVMDSADINVFRKRIVASA